MDYYNLCLSFLLIFETSNLWKNVLLMDNGFLGGMAALFVISVYHIFCSLVKEED